MSAQRGGYYFFTTSYLDIEATNKMIIGFVTWPEFPGRDKLFELLLDRLPNNPPQSVFTILKQYSSGDIAKYQAIFENENLSESLRINALDLMAAWKCDDEALWTRLVVLACTKATPKLRQSIFTCLKASSQNFENTIEKFVDFQFPDSKTIPRSRRRAQPGSLASRTWAQLVT
jgi:hypothetical protein